MKWSRIRLHVVVIIVIIVIIVVLLLVIHKVVYADVFIVVIVVIVVVTGAGVLSVLGGLGGGLHILRRLGGSLHLAVGRDLAGRLALALAVLGETLLTSQEVVKEPLEVVPLIVVIVVVVARRALRRLAAAGGRVLARGGRVVVVIIIIVVIIVVVIVVIVLNVEAQVIVVIVVVIIVVGRGGHLGQPSSATATMPGLPLGLPGWGSSGGGDRRGDRGVQYARIVPEAAQEPTYAYLEMDYGPGSTCGEDCWDGQYGITWCLVLRRTKKASKTPDNAENNLDCSEDEDVPAAIMNIMFRKHFHADKEPGYGFGKASGRSGRSKGHGTHGKRARDAGYSSLAMPDAERDRGYRTHLFLNPSGCQSCGSAVDEDLPPGAGLPPPPSAAPPAPRRSSVTLIKWPSTKRKSSGSLMGGRFDSLDVSPGAGGPPTPTGSASASAPPSRQVSFNKNGQQQQQQQQPQQGRAATSSLPMSRSEPVSLAHLDRDCFIIPLHAVDRFLPEGVPMPEPGQLGQLNQAGQQQALQGGNGNVKVLEVADPLLSVLLHLMTPMEPLEPALESPLASPHRQQGTACADLVQEVSKGNSAVRGMLLTNMEKNSEFPYISYYVINSAQTDPKEFFRSLRSASLRKFDPRNIRYTANHTLDLFNEVATIARPPFDPGYPSAARRPAPATTGYIVSFYKGDKLYLLMVECANFLEDLSAAAVLIPALRARLCGYTGIYRAAPLPAAATPS
ncbi:hypothetical protein FOCC_FOCC012212 [Frankliniella occidentalis]|nr:hypothetical protein FOCC_FOCC012212 [Frankliniella occidentalis]